MAAVTITPTVYTPSIELPVAGPSHKPASGNALTTPRSDLGVLAAGPAFASHARRVVHGRTFADDDAAERAALDELEAARARANAADDDDEEGLGGEAESRATLSLDPKEWKQQDHYEVLGLQHLRYKASDEQIKKAHRRKVLRHHPDKKAGAGGLTNDDSFFKCIAKAMEVLSNAEKRRQFDSVDTAVDDDVPSAKETTPENFFELWQPVFEREGRFSRTQPVPQLGDEGTSREDVHSFYDFWYNFDSWRSFEYLDKDAPEGTDSRDEKRHQEKKNKSERARKKKEDNQRTREFVDLALSLDPRMKKFKAEDKARRDAKKKGSSAAGTPNGTATPRESEQEQQAKAAAEAAAKEDEARKQQDDKAAREQAKKQREQAKKNLKRERKAVVALVTANNYFAPAGESPSAQTVEKQLTELDAILGALEPEDVAALRKEAESAQDGTSVRETITKWAAKVDGKVPNLSEFKA